MSTSKATSKLFRRYVWLANTLYSYGPLSIEEISAKWERSALNDSGEPLPVKTFYNHKLALEEIFNIDVRCAKIGSTWKYSIAESAGLDVDELRRWMLTSISLNNTVSESRDMRERILIDPMPSGFKYLDMIIDAMRGSRTLEITHKGFWKRVKSEKEIEPLCLRSHKQRWYLLARICGTEDVRTFALDRIQDCAMTQTTFSLPDGFDAKSVFSDYYGVFIDKTVPLETVRIRIYDPILNYIRTLPLHHSQTEVATGENYADMEYTIRPTKDFINEIISRGSYFKVLSPESVIRMVEEETSKAVHSCIEPSNI